MLSPFHTGPIQWNFIITTMSGASMQLSRTVLAPLDAGHHLDFLEPFDLIGLCWPLERLFDHV